MPENGQIKRVPALWTSVLIAAVLAITIPLIYFFAIDPMGFSIVLFPIHIPLAFALLWPVVVAVQGPIPGPWFRRHTVAAVTFLIAIVLAWFVYKLETRNAPVRQSSCVCLKTEPGVYS